MSRNEAPILALPQPSVRVLTLSGEELLNTPFLPKTNIRDVKQVIQNIFDVPRFRQRLTRQERNLPDGHVLSETIELTLVQLTYIRTSEEQILELLRAAACGDTARVEHILQRPQNPNECQAIEAAAGDVHMFSALKVATSHGHTDVMSLLLRARADLQMPGNTEALCAAAKQGSPEAARMLLEARADTHLRPGNGVLQAAVEKNHANVLEILLLAKADPQEPSRTESGRFTPLCSACAQGHLEATDLLLCHRADALAREPDHEFCPLDIAIHHEQTRVISLIERDMHQRVHRRPPHASEPAPDFLRTRGTCSCTCD